MDVFLKILEDKGIDVEQHYQPTPSYRNKIGVEFEDEKYLNFVKCLYERFQNRISVRNVPSLNCALEEAKDIAKTYYKSGARPGNIRAIENFLEKHWTSIKVDIEDYSGGERNFVAPGRRIFLDYIEDLAVAMCDTLEIAENSVEFLYQNQSLTEFSHRTLRSKLYGEQFANPNNVSEFNRKLACKPEIINAVNRLVVEFQHLVTVEEEHSIVTGDEEKPDEILIIADAVATALVIDPFLKVRSHKANDRAALKLMKYQVQCLEIIRKYQQDHKSVKEACNDLLRICEDAQIPLTGNILKKTSQLVYDYLYCVHPKAAINLKKARRFKSELGNGLKIEALEPILPGKLHATVGHTARILEDKLNGLNNQTKVKEFSAFALTTRTSLLYLGVGSFANHSCTPNTDFIRGPRQTIYLKALKRIKKGEELTVEYSKTYFGKGNKDCLCNLCKKKRLHDDNKDGMILRSRSLRIPRETNSHCGAIQ